MKQILIPLAALFCLLGFTACGNHTDSSIAKTEVSIQNTQTDQTDSAAGSEQSDETSAAPGQTAQQPDMTDAVKSSAADQIVVFFSATGTTKGVAERIAGVTQADIYELIPAEPYSDADLDWHDKNSRTTIEMNDPDVRPAIANDRADLLDGFTTVYIGYPIWWGDAPRMMSTFVEAHSFDGKTVIPFCTSGSSPIDRSSSNLASQAGSGNWLKGGRLDAGISESGIQDWISGMN